MTVKDLYELMEKKEDRYRHWDFYVYVNGIDNNILAFANAHYDVEGTNKDFDYHIYSVKDLFEHEVVSFYPGCDGLYVKINKFPKMKYWDHYYYKDENGHDKVRKIIKAWNEPGAEKS